MNDTGLSPLDSMCMTWLHDFGLRSPDEQNKIREQLSGLYTHHVAPLIAEVAGYKRLNQELADTNARSAVVLVQGAHEMRIFGPTSGQETQMAEAVAHWFKVVGLTTKHLAEEAAKKQPTPTHWMADCLSPDEWTDDPSPTPQIAAQRFLEIGTDNDDCWEAWNDLERGGMTTIKVRRWDETPEIITDTDQQFDGYEPGKPWFKKTDEVVEVLVSLEFQILKRSTVSA